MSEAPLESPVPPAPATLYCTRCGIRLGELGNCAPCQARDALPKETSKGFAVPLKASLCLYFALFTVVVLGFVTTEVLGLGDSVPAQLTIDGIFAAVVTGACLLGWRHIRPGLSRSAPPIWYAGALLGSMVTFLLANGVITLIEQTGLVDSFRYTDNFAAQGYPFIAVVLSICIVPALFEELAFRGFIQSALQGVLDLREAVIVTALMFAILHLSPVSMVHLAIIGLVLGVMRHRTGSLYPGMLMHFCHNFWVIAAEKWWA